jgi:hypothetical protein
MGEIPEFTSQGITTKYPVSPKKGWLSMVAFLMEIFPDTWIPFSLSQPLFREGFDVSYEKDMSSKKPRGNNNIFHCAFLVKNLEVDHLNVLFGFA